MKKHLPKQVLYAYSVIAAKPVSYLSICWNKAPNTVFFPNTFSRYR